MWVIPISIAGAVIASVLTTKILAAHYFKIVDSYVENMCGETENFVSSCVLELRKHKQNFDREV